MTDPKWPLGKPTDYPDTYDNTRLVAIDRQHQRHKLDALLTQPTKVKLPFHGQDLWNAYELSWLNPQGKPMVGQLKLVIPADSRYTVESKSFKLYLNSLNQTQFATETDLLAQIQQDLSDLVQVSVEVKLIPMSLAVATRPDVLDLSAHGEITAGAPAYCLDDVSVVCQQYQPDAGLLQLNAENSVEKEALYSHLFRSCCPVTQQPDWATILIIYSGIEIDRASLLQYLISYRMHQGFHEACIEQIFVDIKQQCEPSALTVYGRFARRGGVDINPLRSDCKTHLRVETHG